MDNNNSNNNNSFPPASPPSTPGISDPNAPTTNLPGMMTASPAVTPDSMTNMPPAPAAMGMSSTDPLATTPPAMPGNTDLNPANMANALGTTTEISMNPPADPMTPPMPPTPTFVTPETGNTMTAAPTDPMSMGLTTPPASGTDQAPGLISSTDSAPTDLSQLTASAESSTAPVPVQPVFAPQVSNADQTTQPVAQATPTAESVSTVPTSSKLPFVLIGVGIVAVLIATAASAYFILGVGKQPSTETISVPAETQLTNPPKASIAPTTAPIIPPIATSSASPSGTPKASGKPTPTPRPTASPRATASPKAGSAAELLKQKAASPVPSAEGASSTFMTP